MASTPLMSRADPFLLVSDTLTGNLESLHSSLDEWRHLLTTTDTATSGEFQEKERELRSGVLKARKMLVELDKVVSQLEAKRGQHAGMDSAELARRRETLSGHETSVVAIEKALESRQAKDKRAKDKDTAERSRRKKEREAEAAAETAAARTHADFLGQHQGMQQMERERQDEQIDRIDGILETTHQRAILIGQELKHQHTALEDMHGEMSEARTGIEGATARIQVLLQTKDNRMICLVIVLIIILVVLGVIALS